ncbi:MAG: DUF4114 domain-containing protein [Geitlerinemataceae cyanobacterium]
MQLKNVTYSALLAAGIGLLAAPANAYSLRDTAHGESLFQTFNSLVNSERLQLTDSEVALQELDVESLTWAGGVSPVEVFFINEGAGHRNQLLYTVNDGEQQMIFDDIASTESGLAETQEKIDAKRKELNFYIEEKEALEDSVTAYVEMLEARVVALEAMESRSWGDNRNIDRAKAKIDAANQADFDAAQVLADTTKQVSWRQSDFDRETALGNNGVGAMKLGDGANLGTFDGYTAFDFLIKSNGARNANGNIYGVDAEQNADGLQHVIAYEYFDEVKEESWIVLGFEDLYGAHYDEGGHSDRDFNDVVVAIKGVVGTKVDAEEVPEPASALGLLAVSGLMGLSRRRTR